MFDEMDMTQSGGGDHEFDPFAEAAEPAAQPVILLGGPAPVPSPATPSRDPFDDGEPEEPEEDKGQGEEEEEDQEELGDDKEESAPEEEPVEPEGPTAYQLWEEQRNKQLEERRVKAAAVKKALQKEAQEDITKFFADRKKLATSKAERNRKEEKEQREEFASVMEYGTLWEKVARLVDLNPKSGASVAKKHDVSRMRSLLVQLKNEKK